MEIKNIKFRDYKTNILFGNKKFFILDVTDKILENIQDISVSKNYEYVVHIPENEFEEEHTRIVHPQIFILEGVCLYSCFNYSKFTTSLEYFNINCWIDFSPVRNIRNELRGIKYNKYDFKFIVFHENNNLRLKLKY